MSLHLSLRFGYPSAAFRKPRHVGRHHIITTRGRFGSGSAATAVGARRCRASEDRTCPTPVPGARPATVERIKIHGTALEGNLEGDAVDRDAIVFLPPSYNQNRTRRYPVVYALHGYSIGAEQWSQEIHVPQTIEGAFARARTR